MAIRPEESRSGFLVKSVCKRAHLPESFTRKIFQTLVKHKLLTARRGPGGGYRFGRDLRKISVLDVIRAVDGKAVFDKCVTHELKCSQKKHCSFHPMWKKTKAILIQELNSRTLADLIKES